MPYRDTSTPIPQLSWGTPQTVSPSLCPDLGAVPPSVGGPGHIPPPQHLGTTRSPGHSDLGRPFPMGQGGKGRTALCPRPACLVRTARRAPLSQPVPPCTCRLPRSGPAPLPGHSGVCTVTRGAQTATLPAPTPRAAGHTASRSSLWLGADVPGRSGQPAEAESPPCSQTARAERRTPLCTESGTPQSPRVSPCAVRTLSGTGRGGRGGKSSSRTFCGS